MFCRFKNLKQILKEEITRNYIPDYHLVKPIKTRRKLHILIFAVTTSFRTNNHPHNLDYQQPSRTNIRNSKSPVILKHIFTCTIFIHSKKNYHPNPYSNMKRKQIYNTLNNRQLQNVMQDTAFHVAKHCF